MELFGSLFILSVFQLLLKRDSFETLVLYNLVFLLVNAKFQEKVQFCLGFFEDVSVGRDQFLEDLVGHLLIFYGAT